MATVSVYHYTFYYPQLVFYPGTERRHTLGPWPWYQKAIVATAHPFDATNSDRTLVTDVSIQTTTAQTHFLNVVIRNVGKDPIYIYYLEIAELAP